MPLEVRWRDGRIEIEPAPIPLTVRGEGRFLVAVLPDGLELPPLAAETVEQLRQELVDERASSD
jgi:hypothetical protein